jgi:hypothetical protein
MEPPGVRATLTVGGQLCQRVTSQGGSRSSAPYHIHATRECDMTRNDRS